MKLHQELDGDFSIGIDEDGKLSVVDAETFEIVFLITDSMNKLLADPELANDILVDVGHLIRFEMIGSHEYGKADGRAEIQTELHELLGIVRVEKSIERLEALIMGKAPWKMQ